MKKLLIILLLFCINITYAVDISNIRIQPSTGAGYYAVLSASSPSWLEVTSENVTFYNFPQQVSIYDETNGVYLLTNCFNCTLNYTATNKNINIFVQNASKIEYIYISNRTLYLGQNVTIKINGTDPNGVADISYAQSKIGAQTWNSTYTSGYWTNNINSTNITTGTYTFKARMFDVAGNNVTATLDSHSFMIVDGFTELNKTYQKNYTTYIEENRTVYIPFMQHILLQNKNYQTNRTKYLITLPSATNDSSLSLMNSSGSAITYTYNTTTNILNFTKTIPANTSYLYNLSYDIEALNITKVSTSCSGGDTGTCTIHYNITNLLNGSMIDAINFKILSNDLTYWGNRTGTIYTWFNLISGTGTGTYRKKLINQTNATYSAQEYTFNRTGDPPAGSFYTSTYPNNETDTTTQINRIEYSLYNMSHNAEDMTAIENSVSNIANSTGIFITSDVGGSTSGDAIYQFKIEYDFDKTTDDGGNGGGGGGKPAQDPFPLELDYYELDFYFIYVPNLPQISILPGLFPQYGEGFNFQMEASREIKSCKTDEYQCFIDGNIINIKYEPEEDGFLWYVVEDEIKITDDQGNIKTIIVRLRVINIMAEILFIPIWLWAIVFIILIGYTLWRT